MKNQQFCNGSIRVLILHCHVMYTYSDFTVLIALYYMNKAQTEKKNKQKTNKKTDGRDRTKSCPTLSEKTVAEIAESELGSRAIRGTALRPNSALSIIMWEKRMVAILTKLSIHFDQILTTHFKICGLPPLTSTVESHTRESPILLPGYFINSQIRKSSQKFRILNWCNFSCDIVWRASQIFFTQLPNNLSIRFGLNCACVVHRFIFSLCLFVWQITLEWRWHCKIKTGKMC